MEALETIALSMYTLMLVVMDQLHRVTISLPCSTGRMQDFCIDDGAVPGEKIIKDWLELVDLTFKQDPEACIAVHCIAGLGRWAAFLYMCGMC